MAVSEPMLREPSKALPWYRPLMKGWPVLAVTLHILIGTAVWQHLLGDQGASSWGDAFYFSVVTFLTIGYGDMSPTSAAGKACFIVYCVASLVLQLTIVSELVSSTVRFRPPDPEDVDGQDRRATIRTYFKVHTRIWKAVQGFAALFGLIAAGALMLHLTDSSDGGQLSWLDCWYWSITTISTVGYGDIVPSNHRIVFACFFLVAVTLFAYLLGQSVALLTEAKRYKRMDEFFAKGLTPEILRAMDIFQDGQVAKVEFLMFVLDRLELVGQDEMNRILEMFDEADEVGDGVLNLQDTHNRLSGALGEGRLGDVDVEVGGAIDVVESQPILRKHCKAGSSPPSA